MLYLLIPMAVILLYGPHLWASYVLNQYNKDSYFSGNGMELASLLLEKAGIRDVKVEKTQIGDHYDPLEKAVRLTEKRCGKKTLTAVVVAAHEVGHAIQDHTGYAPLLKRTQMIGTAAKLEKMGAAIIFLIPVVTLVTRIPAAGFLLFLGGLGTLCVPLLVHILTLPTEFDASFNRALPMLSTGDFIPMEDIPAAKRILLACALTYVAGALMGLLNIWRWLRVLRR